MLHEHINNIVRENIGYEPTKSQEQLIQAFGKFVTGAIPNEVLLVVGYAGTGKTTLISAFVKALAILKQKSYLLAPTGRAAKVISSYSGRPAYTIHKKIYRQKSSGEGFGSFVLDRNLNSHTFFIVDEASMIANNPNESAIFGSGMLLNDLIEYVYNQQNCKLILVGDTAQLPPVGLEISPALDYKVLEGYGLKVTRLFLDDVIRQAEDSGILFNATSVRWKITNNESDLPQFRLTNFPDIRRINGTELLEELSSCYDSYGQDQVIVVSRSNKRAIRYNQGVRSQILYREDELVASDLLMVVKNNYFWLRDYESVDFIANGDIVRVIRMGKKEEKYGYRFANVTLQFSDYNDVEIEAKVILNSLIVESAALSADDNKSLYYAISEDYSHITNKRKRYEALKSDPYFNALQVKYAYAVTCHKAQGGQWKAVFVDQGFVDDNTVNIEYLRWLYTALTRATERLYLVNFKDQFFEDSTMA